MKLDNEYARMESDQCSAAFLVSTAVPRLICCISSGAKIALPVANRLSCVVHYKDFFFSSNCWVHAQYVFGKDIAAFDHEGRGIFGDCDPQPR